MLECPEIGNEESGYLVKDEFSASIEVLLYRDEEAVDPETAYITELNLEREYVYLKEDLNYEMKLFCEVEEFEVEEEEEEIECDLGYTYYET